MNALNFSPIRQKIDEFYSHERTFQRLMEILFKVENRGSTIKTEIYAGFVHFLSTAMILAVNPSQLVNAGYDRQQVATATAFSCGIACLLTGLLANLPFVSTPSLATVIYYSVSMRIQKLTIGEGNLSVFILGFLLMICSVRVIADFNSWITPYSVKLGICVGFALLVSLQALTHLKIVIPGEYTILTLGNVWQNEVVIAMTAFNLIGVLLHYKVKGAYVCGLFFGSIVYWTTEHRWPSQFYDFKGLTFNVDFSTIYNKDIWICVFDLFIVSSVLLAGLSIGLADLAGISREDGSAPRRRWLYFSCGLGTIISGCLGSGPILLSVESAPGIVAGARTGLSTCVCGLCFLSSVFFYPLFASIPTAGTGPVLLMVGLLLFENTSKVDWRNIKEALPVFITAIFCAFTYSILYGVMFGIAAHIVMITFSGDAYVFVKTTIRGGSDADLRRYQFVEPALDTNSISDDDFSRSRPRLGSFDMLSVGVGDGADKRAKLADDGAAIPPLPPIEQYQTFSRTQVPFLEIPPLENSSGRTPTSDDSPVWPSYTPSSRKRHYRRSLSIGESSILSQGARHNR